MQPLRTSVQLAVAVAGENCPRCEARDGFPSLRRPEEVSHPATVAAREGLLITGRRKQHEHYRNSGGRDLGAASDLPVPARSLTPCLFLLSFRVVPCPSWS